MNEWMNHPKLKDMDPLKKELFEQAAKKVQGKKGNAMASVMMSLILNANRQGIRFTSDEITMILEILKENKSEEERKQIDQTVQFVQKMQKGNHKS